MRSQAVLMFCRCTQELATVAAAPACGAMLADYGATVTKVRPASPGHAPLETTRMHHRMHCLCTPVCAEEKAGILSVPMNVTRYLLDLLADRGTEGGHMARQHDVQT
jgi:hypothetical protein